MSSVICGVVRTTTQRTFGQFFFLALFCVIQKKSFSLLILAAVAINVLNP